MFIALAMMTFLASRGGKQQKSVFGSVTGRAIRIVHSFISIGESGMRI